MSFLKLTCAKGICAGCVWGCAERWQCQINSARVLVANLFLIIFVTFYLVCFCVWASGLMWWSEDNLWRLSLFFCHVIPGMEPRRWDLAGSPLPTSWVKLIILTGLEVHMRLLFVCYIRMCMHVYMCVCLCVEFRSWCWVSFSITIHLLFLRYGLSLNLELTDWLNWLPSKSQDPPVSVFQCCD